MKNSKDRFQSGFTLMEVMVVLVIVSMAATVMMQGFSFVMQIRIRLLQHQEKQITDRLFTHWFQGVIKGISPGFDDPAVPVIEPPGLNTPAVSFLGSASHIRGLTFSPLGRKPGPPALFTMELRQSKDQVHLYYSGPEKEQWKLESFPADRAAFSFFDRQGKWHDQWPPDRGMSDQIPLGIRLVVTGAPGKQVWFSKISGRLSAKPSLRTVFGDFTG